MSVTGNVKIKDEKTYKEAHIEWEVTDFFSVAKNAGYSRLISPTFSFAVDLWFLELYPKSSYYPGFMVLYINNERLREYSVEYKFGLKKLDGRVEQLLTGILEEEKRYNAYNERFIELSKIRRRRSELAPSDVLTITCTLRRETTQPTVLDQPKHKKLRKLDTLSENFKDLFGNKKSWDTTLRLGDNEYKVHKAVLIARSSVFDAMFQHEMSEKQTGVITIADCDPETFKEFLEFMYCGAIEDLSYRNAFHLYQTSDKYDVQELKTFCIKCLVENLTVENVCEVLIMADRYDDSKLNSSVLIFFNVNVIQILETSEWECLIKDNHRLANKILKEMLKVNYRKRVANE